MVEGRRLTAEGHGTWDVDFYERLARVGIAAQRWDREPFKLDVSRGPDRRETEDVDSGFWTVEVDRPRIAGLLVAGLVGVAVQCSVRQ